MDYVILAINPGSTSTKIALFNSGELVFQKSIAHNVEEVRQFEKAADQLEYRFQEVFGTGTAAVISPVGKLSYHDEVIEINNNKIGETCKLIYDNITGIQNGTVEDKFGWIVTV